jgi:CBS domain containing-hemolysin-like protein
MTLLLIYLAVAIGVSFFCSILEAVLLSIPPSYIASTKGKTSLLLEYLKKDIDRPLASILSLNTVAHTVGAAGVGAQAQIVFQNLPFSVISGILTLLILVFSEIIPKTLGAQYWRPLSIPCAYLIKWLIYLMWPLVFVSSMFSRLLTRGKSCQATISRDEIRAIADLGHQEGILDTYDTKILHSLMAFQSIKIERILTPRTVVSTFSADQKITEVINEVKNTNYSRYPILNAPEEVLGYVLRSEILMAAANDKWQTKLFELLHELPIITEQIPVKKALGIFLRGRVHIAAVVDEFGSFSGVVTLEDVIETLIGHEIMDEGDTVENLRQFARESIMDRFDLKEK